VSTSFGAHFGVNDHNFVVDRYWADQLLRGVTEDYYFNEVKGCQWFAVLVSTFVFVCTERWRSSTCTTNTFMIAKLMMHISYCNMLSMPFKTLDIYSWGNPERRIYKVASTNNIPLRTTSLCEQPLIPLRGKYNG
jgi:hypothetical protein